MNEKIKSFYFKSLTTVGDYSYCKLELDSDKFAKLIINECYNISERIRKPAQELRDHKDPYPNIEYLDGFIAGVAYLVSKIEEEFGVEYVE